MADVEFRSLPPAQAIDYFRKKGYAIRFNWRDMWQEEHAYAFTVAKAMRTDILQDIRQAMDKAIAEGTTLDTFRKDLRPLLQAKGWWGKKLMTDPVTGEEKLVQLGSARRLQTIFQTNMRTAYAAGRWETIKRTQKSQPYLRYSAVLDIRTRDQHRQWNDIVLPVDHPWWDSHYPPNGWNCRCSVIQANARTLDRLKLSVSPPPKITTIDYVDKRNGVTLKVPKGIDPGFGYNAGQARMRGTTPPPLNKPLDVPFSGDPAQLPPPESQPIPADLVMLSGLDESEYVAAFLKRFKMKPGQAKVFEDVTGESLVISEDLFRDARGKSKVLKRGRAQYLPALAETIIDPDEIWHIWQEYPKGRMTLSRHYLKFWKDDGKGVSGFTLFDTSAHGWDGVTSFTTDDLNYVLKRRAGALVYRKVRT